MFHSASSLTAPTEFISPPVTPKLQMDSFHEDGWDTSSTTSSTSSIACISPLSSNCLRRKQKPMQSLPRSTKGTFCMPTFVPTSSSSSPIPTTIPTQWIQSSNQEHLPQKKRKHQQTSQSNGVIQCKLTPTQRIPSNTSIMTNNTLVSSTKRTQPDELPAASAQPKIAHGDVLTTDYIQSTEPIVETNDPPQSNSSQQQQSEEDTQTIKKAKTSAAYIYDNLSADMDQSVVFKDCEEWIPKLDVLDRRPHVRISWKGSPLKIRNMPYFEKLHAGEVTIAATLRLTPEQYLKCKWALVLAAKEASENNTLFRKSEAQKVCCIDVNKTSVLWNAFGKLGWLGSKWPQ